MVLRLVRPRRPFLVGVLLVSLALAHLTWTHFFFRNRTQTDRSSAQADSGYVLPASKHAMSYADIKSHRSEPRVVTAATRPASDPPLPPCQIDISQLVGHRKPNIYKRPSEKDVEAELPNVSRGCWRPPSCRAANGSIALLFPSQNRIEHLLLTLKYLIPHLQRQLQDFCVYAGEQAAGSAKDRFNKGATVDALFKEAMAERNWTCVAVHDVDMIPEDARMSYSCPGDHVRHLTAAIDKWSYGLPYSQVFGGGTISMSRHFVQYNGLSTAFWGWGTEDDDHRQRIGWAGLSWARLDKTIARYTHIPHESSKVNPDRFWFAHHARQVWQDYGLNTLKYSVVEAAERKLYKLFKLRFPEQGPSQVTVAT